MNARTLHPLLLAACAAFASGASALEPDVLFSRISPSVWSVRTFDAQERPLRTGTAVVIAPGRLVTTCHVLAKASSFAIRQDNVSYGATLEQPDPRRDLCQIRVANFSAKPVPIAPVGSAKVGQRVYAIGNPRGVENTLGEGLLTGLRGGDDAEVPLLQSTAAVPAGSSGGGLFDQEGRLLGITSIATPNDGLSGVAIPASFLADLPLRAEAALAAHGREQAASPAGVAAAVAVTPGSPLRVGDALEYLRTDRLTGNRTPVIYRLDRVAGDELFFNAGGRVEKSDGRVSSVITPIGGFYDTASPPGGWARKDIRTGMRWHVDFMSTAGDRSRHEMDAVVVGERSMRVDDTEVKAFEIRYEGWLYTGYAAGAPLGPSASRLTASVWYAPAMARVVRFEAKSTRPPFSATDESLELVRIQR